MKQPILFDVISTRENDAPIIRTIEALRFKGASTVFINCGILSHPAILMREAGIRVLQSYALYERYKMLQHGHGIEPVTPVQLSTELYHKDHTQEKLIFGTSQMPQALVYDKHYTVPIHLIAESAIETVGKKAYSLSKLAKAGFPIPKGFVITTAAFHEWRTRSDTGTKDLPSHLLNCIIRIYSQMGMASVAVRSSSTGEDSARRSAAGVYKTTLNVKTYDELCRAIVSGFQSIDSEEAQSYGSNFEISDLANRPAMALIVQEMINADISGVMFTYNPVTHRSNEVVINMTKGSGAPLVSGKVPGNTYILDEHSNVLNSYINEPAETSDETCVITRQHLRELVQIGKAIEYLFGIPQDIEFALNQNRLWILQSRPITTIRKDLAEAER